MFLQELVCARILGVSDRLRGTHVLQIGGCGNNPWLKNLPFRRHWLLTPCADDTEASIVSSINALPFERGSVDCVIAPFTMEMSAPDKRIIHEIDRILKPMGHIIFIGINPFSLWGLFLKLGLIKPFDALKMHLTSSLTLKQLMLNQGYRLNKLETFCYVPPVNSAEALLQLRFLDEMGKMVILSPAGFYCLVVQKYQYAKPRMVAQKRKQPIKIGEAVAGLARISE